MILYTLFIIGLSLIPLFIGYSLDVTKLVVDDNRDITVVLSGLFSGLILGVGCCYLMMVKTDELGKVIKN